MKLATKEAPVATVAQLTHLYVGGVDILNFLSAPLLSSLPSVIIRPRIYQPFPPSIEMSSRKFERWHGIIHIDRDHT